MERGTCHRGALGYFDVDMVEKQLVFVCFQYLCKLERV